MSKTFVGCYYLLVLSLPRVLLFPIAEKVDKKATAAPDAPAGFYTWPLWDKLLK